MDELVKYLVVVLWSTLKFIAGIVAGFGFKLPWWLTGLLTAGGMMLAVSAFTFWLGDPFQRFVLKYFYKKDRKLFTTSNRRKVKIWSKYGLAGIAFFTPILFSPIGGSMIANSFGAHKRDILIYMALSAVFWAFILSYFGGLLNLLVKASPIPNSF